MTRHLRGRIFEASGKFYVQYRVDGEWRSEFLCSADAAHYSKTKKCKPGECRREKCLGARCVTYYSPAVQQRCGEVMLRINAERGETERMTAAAYWEMIYAPFAKENVRPSTMENYAQQWRKHLEPRFGKRLMSDVTTKQATAFLTELAKTQSKNSLRSIRATASAMFTHAAATIDGQSNPWRDAKVLGKPKETPRTEHYTREEIEDIISALVEHVECQLIMALAFFQGLMPSECVGLKWSDVDAEWIHIRRVVVRRVLSKDGVGKTENRIGSVPLIEPTRTFLSLWHQKLGRPADGWVFPGSEGRPMCYRNLADRTIRPILAAKGLEWKGYYAARRGGGTVIKDLSTPIVAAQFLRNDPATALKHYLKPSEAPLVAATKLLEAEAKGGD